MRRIVNKKLEAGEIRSAVAAAAEGGLEALKLYGMVGLPGESDADVEATIDMMAQARRRPAPSPSSMPLSGGGARWAVVHSPLGGRFPCGRWFRRPRALRHRGAARSCGRRRRGCG